MGKAERRIREYYQSWFMTEAVLFACVNTHTLVKNNKIKTMRSGKGLIEYNESFIEGLEEKELRELLIFEAFRILCKHPYDRKKPNPIANMTGSNVTIQEYLATHLEMPQARAMFEHLLKKNRSEEQDEFMKIYEQLKELDDDELEKMTGMSKAKLEMIRGQVPDFQDGELDRRHFEFYYKLVEDNIPEMIQQSPTFQKMKQDVQDKKDQKQQSSNGEDKSDPQDAEDETGGTLEDHFDPLNALDQQENWGESELLTNDIDEAIRDASLTQNWGSVPGHAQADLLASLNPKVNYKGILKRFRASIISSNTRLSRMKPSRRFGFGFPGKKRDFSTRLAFFVDVSGSMTDDILSKGFGIVNKFFTYGIKEVDVYQFDTELKNDGKPLKMDRAKRDIKLMGRGGTDFQVVLDKLSNEKNYDGVIVYTDGWAQRPTVPKGVNAKDILWLFDKEDNYNAAYPNLKGIGRAAFVRSDREY